MNLNRVNKIFETNCGNCGLSLKVEYAYDHESNGYGPIEFYEADDQYCSIPIDKCPGCKEILEM